MNKAKEFTGKKMLMTMAGAFAVIIAVNLLMASLAIGTFPGTIVKNTYVASQDYNRHVEAARTRAALEWRTELTLKDGQLLLTVLDSQGAPVEGLAVKGRAGRPASQLDDRELTLMESKPAHYQMPLVLKDGRWELRLHGHDASGALQVAIAKDVWVEGQ